MEKLNAGLEVIVKAEAPELKAISPIAVVADVETPVVLDVANVAVPVGTIDGTQLLLVFQSPLPGVVLHMAFWANASRPIDNISATTITPTLRTDCLMFFLSLMLSPLD